MKRSIPATGLLCSILLAACATGGAARASSGSASRYTSTPSISSISSWGNLNCHDPALFRDDDGLYYAFSTDAAIGGAWPGGIQIRVSGDLQSWRCLPEGAIPSDGWDPEMLEWCGFQAGDAGKHGAASWDAYTWAPCVIKLNGKYLMYHGVITDADKDDPLSSGPRAWIGLAIADKVTGPYIPANRYDPAAYKTGTVVRYCWRADSDLDKDCLNEGQGFWTFGFGAIDPHAVRDAHGDLWLNYGSWKGGIAILRLDNRTGLPLCGAPADVHPQGAGKQIAGGSGGAAVEGACVVQLPGSSYYWLFNSQGHVESDYSVRVSRCPKTDGIDGTYRDSLGTAMNDASWATFHTVGNKILGGFKLGNGFGWRAPGGQSLLVDGDRVFFASHTRTDFRPTYFFYLQIRELFMTADGWPVLNPNEYAGETLRDVAASDLVGAWDCVLSVTGVGEGDFSTYEGGSSVANLEDAEATQSQSLVLVAEGETGGRIEGSWSGTWTLGAESSAGVSGAGKKCHLTLQLKTPSGEEIGTWRGLAVESTDMSRGVSGERTWTLTTFSPATGRYFFGNRRAAP